MVTHSNPGVGRIARASSSFVIASMVLLAFQPLAYAQPSPPGHGSAPPFEASASPRFFNPSHLFTAANTTTDCAAAPVCSLPRYYPFHITLVPGLGNMVPLYVSVTAPAGWTLSPDPIPLTSAGWTSTYVPGSGSSPPSVVFVNTLVDFLQSSQGSPAIVLPIEVTSVPKVADGTPEAFTVVVSAINETTSTLSATSVGLSSYLLPAVTVVPDTTPPSACTSAFSGAPGTNGWYQSSGILTLTGADAVSNTSLSYNLNGAGYQSGSSFPVTRQGVSTFTCRASDAAGNVATFGPSTISIDSIAPVPSASVQGTLQANGFYLSPARVNVNAVDPKAAGAQSTPSGVRWINLTLDGRPFATPVNAIFSQDPAQASVLSPEIPPGTHTVGFSATDAAGNVNASTLSLRVAGSLASIALNVTEANVTVGSSLPISAAGADAIGDPIILDPSWASTCPQSISGTGPAVAFAAPTTAGTTCDVTANQEGVTSPPTLLRTVHGALASIGITPPAASLIANTSQAFSALGFDSFGNAFAVPITWTATCGSIDSTGLYTAPKAAPLDCSVMATSGGLQAVAPVGISHDALASIAVNGPATLVAGNNGTYAVAGADQYGNAVPLGATNFTFTAPTHDGSTEACFTEGAITGCEAVGVVSGALATILVSGPPTIPAAENRTYTLAGQDRFGNPVPLAASSLVFTAPNLAGPVNVTYSEQGVLGSETVLILPARLARIVITGPSTMVAGTQAPFGLQGFDRFGNVVQLGRSVEIFSAPTAAGFTNVTFADNATGVVGVEEILVVPAPLAVITVSGPASLVANQTAPYELRGADVYGNNVALPAASFNFTAPRRVGTYEVAYTLGTITGVEVVSVVAGPLAAITLTGPSTMVVNTTATFALAGFDAYGNPVPLANATLYFTAPSVPGLVNATYTEAGVTGTAPVNVTASAPFALQVQGPASLVVGQEAVYNISARDAFGNPVAVPNPSYTLVAPFRVPATGIEEVCILEGNVTACFAVRIVPDALATIFLDGPAEMVANTSATFALSGSDQYGNPVPLAQSQISFLAPTRAGVTTVTYGEQGILGAATVRVVHDVLASLDLLGPSLLVANATAPYAVVGFDRYGNDVPTDPSALVFQAPAHAGLATVATTQGGVAAAKTVRILPGPLASITVSGPANLVVGSTATFTFSGADQFGNPVALQESTRTITAPTQPGSIDIFYNESGVSGLEIVNVVLDQPFRIVVAGPSSPPAGSTQQYSLSAVDRFGNPFPLQKSSLTVTVSTFAGPAEVCYTEGNVTGCETIEVSAGPLARIFLQGPDAMNAGTTAVFELEGFDAFGNLVALAQPNLTFVAPTGVGSATVQYAEQGIVGSVQIEIDHNALATIAIDGPATVAAGSTTAYLLSGADAFGNPVALNQSALLFVAPHAVGPATVSYSESGITATKTVNVVHAALAVITVSGPTSMIVATTATFALAGFDTFGNGVPLAQGNLSVTAPELVGNGTLVVPYTQGGILGEAFVHLLPDALASIALSGPTKLTVGRTFVYNLSGADRFGNAVGLSQTTLSFPAPTVPGQTVVSYGENSVVGTLVVNVAPGPLAQIVISGPANVVAGENATFGLAGFDVFGNAVGLAQSTLVFAAPTLAGPAFVTYTDGAVVGNRTVTVVHGPLHDIVVRGPTTVPANSTVVYTLDGLDAFGNAVPLSKSTLVFKAPPTEGPANVTYTDPATNITGTLPITVTPPPALRIVVVGPSSLVVGKTATYFFEGFNRAGKAVLLNETFLNVTAPTTVGVIPVCYTQDNATGCEAVSIVHDALAAITISGPTTVVAGTTTTYALAGFDQYGNAVPLNRSTLLFAPTRSGPTPIQYAQGPVSTTLEVEVQPAALSHIVIKGPDTALIADTTATFALAGFDLFGNAVSLAQTTLLVPVPPRAGPATVYYNESGVSGSLTYLVVHAKLASISLTGPANMVVGTTASFALAGADAFGNAVPLAQQLLSFTAPAKAGAVHVTYTESGVTGSLLVNITASAPFTITVSGPASLLVGATGTYGLAAVDKNGNAVTLQQSSLAFTAPRAPGPVEVCYTEQSVSGCETVTVVSAALATIVVAGPSAMNAGTTATFSLAGFDAFGNPVPLAQSALSFTAPTRSGSATVTYTENGITGQKAIEIDHNALSTITITGPSTVTAGSIALYSLNGFDAFGNPVALAQASLRFSVPTAAGASAVVYRESGISGTLAINVRAGPLATIAVTGPASVVAGTASTYALAGFDQFGNSVPLAASSLTYTASKTAGPATVAYTEQGVTGTLAIQIVHDKLATIAITGPASLVVGTTGTYALGGADQYGNKVPLLQTSLAFKAPNKVGAGTVFYNESGVVGSLPVTFLPGALSQIVLSGPTAFLFGTPSCVAANPVDAFGNTIPGLAPNWSVASGSGSVGSTGCFNATSAGNATLSASIGAVSATWALIDQTLPTTDLGIGFTRSAVLVNLTTTTEPGATLVATLDGARVNALAPIAIPFDKPHRLVAFAVGGGGFAGVAKVVDAESNKSVVLTSPRFLFVSQSKVTWTQPADAHTAALVVAPGSGPLFSVPTPTAGNAQVFLPQGTGHVVLVAQNATEAWIAWNPFTAFLFPNAQIAGVEASGRTVSLQLNALAPAVAPAVTLTARVTGPTGQTILSRPLSAIRPSYNPDTLLAFVNFSAPANGVYKFIVNATSGSLASSTQGSLAVAVLSAAANGTAAATVALPTVTAGQTTSVVFAKTTQTLTGVQAKLLNVTLSQPKVDSIQFVSSASNSNVSVSIEESLPPAIANGLFAVDPALALQELEINITYLGGAATSLIGGTTDGLQTGDAGSTGLPNGSIVMTTYMELKQLSVAFQGADESTIHSGKITFTMSQTDFNDTGVKPAEIQLLHLQNGNWVPLPTALVSEGKGGFVFSALTPSFSPFAIAALLTKTVQVPGSPSSTGGVSGTGSGSATTTTNDTAIVLQALQQQQQKQPLPQPTPGGNVSPSGGLFGGVPIASIELAAAWGGILVAGLVAILVTARFRHKRPPAS